ncbi:MAG: putative Holliday junction resolvase-like endonuclease [Ascidiaceihabitans sp.]|jgi:predicted Holliday junction resolvase-like endonuclease
MKPQRSRSRSKNNRNRPNNNNVSGTNVVNRVFDSSGPEGKVRGTPQQIIDKYNQLARDAQLANDRVATETFQQHAEHYMRMLSEATREMEVRREEQERQNRERQIEQDRVNRERQAERDRERDERIERQEQHAKEQPVEQPAATVQPVVSSDLSEAPQPDLPDFITAGGDSGLVETPEAQPKPKPRQRRKPRPKPVEQATDQADAPQTPEAPEAAE